MERAHSVKFADDVQSNNTDLDDSFTDGFSSKLQGSEVSGITTNSISSSNSTKDAGLNCMKDAIKRLRFFVRAYQAIKSSKSEDKKGLDLFMIGGNAPNIPEEIEDEDNGNVFKSFDVRQYQSKEEFTWPVFAYEAIWRKPHERGVRDIKKIRGLLKGLKNYRLLPPDVQEKVAKYVHLERCTRGRVVIRRGQRAEAFFFLFAGSIKTTAHEDEEAVYMKSKVLGTLCKGDWFGGLAMASGIPRVITAVTMEDCEFLVVDDTDFEECGLKQYFINELNDRYKWLRSHTLLATVSDETLKTVLYESHSHRLPHDEVIIKDSKCYDSILLVYSGSCKAMQWKSEEENEYNFPVMKHNVIENTNLKNNRAKTAKSFSKLTREMQKLNASVGALPIEFTTYPLLDIPRDAQLLHWKTLREARILEKNRTEGMVKRSKRGVFVEVCNIRKNECFGHPADLAHMESLKVISSKAQVIIIPESTFNRYFDDTVRSNIRMAFQKIKQLQSRVTDQFESENTWQGFKNRLLKDVCDQRENIDLLPSSSFGGRAKTASSRLQYNPDRPSRSKSLPAVRFSALNFHKATTGRMLSRRIPQQKLITSRPTTTQSSSKSITLLV